MRKDERVNILLVDDQPAKLLSSEAVLRELDENILSVTSAREALEQLLKHPVAVILIDVCMPDLDGFELASMIRDHPRFKSTPIIFVSAIALTDIDRLKGYEHGAVDYVPVPVVPEILRAKVKVFVELYRKSRQLELLNAQLERRVAERTAELEQTNAELERRVEERTQERESALAQVHEMQKLESLGQLTGGLAHDFNNVLMAILGQLDLIERDAGASNAKRLIDHAIRATERGAALTKRMLAFARRQELRPKAVDVPALANGMLEMLSRSLGPAINISISFTGGVPPVRVDPNQLELALLNLCLNSRDAMTEGGKLVIGARGEYIAANQVFGLSAGKYVCISVIDTGAGMDEMTLKRAAEPFFTTKGVGKGTGLGLSMVHGLATQSGGTIRIASRRSGGTTVELWLPEAPPGDIAGDRSADNIAQSQNGAARIVLLVEDDALVSASTCEMLEYLGHQVISCGSGREAMDVIKSGREIDLVITDHAMPGMSGQELARHIGEIRLGLPIILATGYAERSDESALDLLRLDKPYRINELSSMISVAMAETRSPKSGAA